MKSWIGCKTHDRHLSPGRLSQLLTVVGAVAAGGVGPLVGAVAAVADAVVHAGRLEELGGVT